MKLNEVTAYNAGFWVSPKSKIVTVTTNHIGDIISYPNKFGVTRDYINDVYKRYGERVGQEGEARHEIIEYVLNHGWIRVRRYRNYWSVTVDELSRPRLRTIRNFVHTLVKDGAMHKYDELRILDMKNDSLKTVNAEEVIYGGLNEELEILEYASYDEVKDLINESSLSRIHSKINKHCAGAITAYRSVFTHKQNQIRNKALYAKLSQHGFSITSIQGHYIEKYGTPNEREVTEHTYFVVNQKVDGDDGGELKKVLVDLGIEFDQDSILYIPFEKPAVLIGTSHRSDSWPTFGKVEEIGNFKGGKAAKFMSRVKGRTFVFEDLNPPTTINGIRGLEILAKKNLSELMADQS